MNLLFDPWVPVRADGGTGAFRLLTYRQLLCEPGNWQVSLPRDDLELACLQLLVCMTQVMFLPEDIQILRKRLAEPLPPEAFDAGIAPCRDWFDLDHPTQPFMQSRGVMGKMTTVQKLLPGLPEKTSTAPSAHCFFNEVMEIRNMGGPIAAIALFNQASNSPSFGGGFQGSLRGGGPITTLVAGPNLREMVWRNVLTRPRVHERQIGMPGPGEEQPNWVKPIREGETIHWNEIGLARGLFWQPARVELIRAERPAPCDMLGGEAVPVYVGFRAEQFKFTVEGRWPHPHGAMTASTKKGALEWKFAAFTTTAPAWTLLTEFVVPKSADGPGAKEGCVPAGPVSQAAELGDGRLELMVGGYRVENGAAIRERRHELMSLAQGWADDKRRLQQLVDIGIEVKSALHKRLQAAGKGDRNKGLKGIGAAIHESAEKLFYARTEGLIHAVFSNALTFKEWQSAKAGFTEQLAGHCRAIFEELTDPYAMKPELIPVIAWAWRSLNTDLAKLKEGA